MKAKIIGIASGLSVLGLAIFAVVQMNRMQWGWSVFAVALSLVPLYFLYAIVVLKKYRDKSPRISEDEKRREMMLNDNRLYRTKTPMKKAANDYGKVLDFPKDKQKKRR